MRYFQNLFNIAYKRQKLILGFAIFSAFLAVSFKIGDFQYVWLWTDFPIIALILISLCFIAISIWLKIEKEKIQSKIDAISNETYNANNLYVLTNRQLQVFELIAEGYSNKEIANKLFIEMSTLKTHINKIYKSLNISDRKDFRSYTNK